MQVHGAGSEAPRGTLGTGALAACVMALRLAPAKDSRRCRAPPLLALRSVAARAFDGLTRGKF
jgi:hypothetical protein